MIYTNALKELYAQPDYQAGDEESKKNSIGEFIYD
jgi:hypothetical protein